MNRKHPREIPLTTGETALIDEEDYDLVSRSKWYSIVNENWVYATSKRSGENVLMHHLVYGKPADGYMTHHKNDNGLDNQKSNLQFVTNKQNQARSRKTGYLTHSKYKGVSFRKDTGKWVAYIRVNYKMTNLGSFADEVEAAKAYDEAAREAFGEFARTNF